MNNSASRKRTLVSTGIVTFNSEDHIEKCLNSVFSQDYERNEVIVWDNGSIDNTIGIVSQYLDKLKLFKGEVNLGFAKAHNKLIAISEGKYYLCLNPDVVLRNDFLSQLMMIAEKYQDLAAIGGILFENREGKKISTAGHYYDIFFVPHHVTKKLSLHTAFVPGISAAACLYNKDCLKSIDYGQGEYFDELFFMYREDCDLDLRFKAKGYKCIICNSAVGYHTSGATKNLQNPYIEMENIKNLILALLKNLNIAHLALIAPYHLINLFFLLLKKRELAVNTILFIKANFREIVEKRHLSRLRT
jgi:GT2 family glycosyltransferase